MLLPMTHLVIIMNFLLVNCQDKRGNCDERKKCLYNEEAVLPVCYCDPTCFEFNDCCKEYVIYNNQTSNSDSTDLLYSCVNIIMEAGKRHVKLGSFMIDICLKSRSACNVTDGNLETLVPVSSGNVTFRNSFCAKCNGVMNFTYWGISYDIRKVVEVNSLDLQSLLHENASINLKTDIFPKEGYNLYPPNGYKPRYCQSDIYNGKKVNKEDDGKYQNFALCKDTFYKNIEECVKSDFCESDDCRCASYDPTYITTFGDLMSGKVTGIAKKSLQILVQLKPKLPETQGSTEGQSGELSLTFIRKRVHFYFELNLEKQTMPISSMQSIEECLIASMVFLESSKYGLVAEFSTFHIRTNNGITYNSAVLFRSMAKLYTNDLETLLNLHVTLQFQTEIVETTVNGYVRTVPMDFKYATPAKTERKSPRSTKVILVQHDVPDNCKNLTFIRQIRSTSIPIVYDVACDNIDTVNNIEINFAHVCFLSVTLALLSLIFAWALPILATF